MHHVDNGHDLTSHTAITRDSSTVTLFQISSPKCSIQLQNHLDMSFMMSNSETPHLDPTSNLQQNKQSSRKNLSKTQPNLPPPNSCSIIIGCVFPMDPRNSKWKRSSSSKAVAPNLGSAGSSSTQRYSWWIVQLCHILSMVVDTHFSWKCFLCCHEPKNSWMWLHEYYIILSYIWYISGVYCQLGTYVLCCLPPFSKTEKRHWLWIENTIKTQTIHLSSL